MQYFVDAWILNKKNALCINSKLIFIEMCTYALGFQD